MEKDECGSADDKDDCGLGYNVPSGLNSHCGLRKPITGERGAVQFTGTGDV